MSRLSAAVEYIKQKVGNYNKQENDEDTRRDAGVENMKNRYRANVEKEREAYMIGYQEQKEKEKEEEMAKQYETMRREYGMDKEEKPKRTNSRERLRGGKSKRTNKKSKRTKGTISARRTKRSQKHR